VDLARETNLRYIIIDLILSCIYRYSHKSQLTQSHSQMAPGGWRLVTGLGGSCDVCAP